MSAQVEVSWVVDRPVAKVFHFYAHDHVRNHPRWDPDIELWKTSDDPIGLGTVLRRRNSRSGTPVDGTMEVIEFENDQAFGVVILDGSMEIRARAIFEQINDNQTKMTTVVELPGMDETMDKSFLISGIERSGQKMKQLMEAEI